MKQPPAWLNDLVREQLRAATEDGIRMGIGMCISTIEKVAAHPGVTEPQQDMCAGMVAAMRQASAEFTLPGSAVQ